MGHGDDLDVPVDDDRLLALNGRLARRRRWREHVDLRDAVDVRDSGGHGLRLLLRNDDAHGCASAGVEVLLKHLESLDGVRFPKEVVAVADSANLEHGQERDHHCEQARRR